MTSDQGALFEDYPAKPPKRKPRIECCQVWMDFVAYRAEHHLGLHPIWKMAHRFAHSRIPFSTAVLASMANSTEGNAERVIEGAEDAEWIVRVQPEFDGQLSVPLWMGRLDRKGR